MVFKNHHDMPNACPPDNAIRENKQPVYRFLKGETISNIDFLNHKELDIRYPEAKECEAMAISFFTTYDAVTKKRNQFKKFRNSVVAEGRITENCGVHVVDETDHLNLWLFNNVDMLRIFTGEECEGDGNE